MKKLLALLLTVLYVAFTAGGLGNCVTSGADGTGLHVSHATGSQEDGSTSCSSDLNVCTLHKALTHLHANGKIKVPRSSAFQCIFSNFFLHSYSPYAYVQASAVTLLPEPSSVYLRNCVLRI